jgi:hypothetical protein
VTDSTPAQRDREAAELDVADDAFTEWQAARRALDETLDAFQSNRASTRELFIRVAELRRSEEVAWAAVQERLASSAE